MDDWRRPGSGDQLIVQADIGGGPLELNETFNEPIDTNLTTTNITVPLNTPVSFSLMGNSRITDSVVDAEGGSGLAILDHANPFNLPVGYTLNSVSASITDNMVTPVPSPTTLVCGAILLLGGTAEGDACIIDAIDSQSLMNRVSGMIE